MTKKITVLFICILMPLLSHAQKPGMDPAQMQQMMQQAQQMQDCFAQVDQQALMAIGQKAQAMESEVKSLCQAGKRSEAQDTAIQFGLAMSQDENVIAARECGKMAQGMMPKMDFPTSEEDFKEKHLCDGY